MGQSDPKVFQHWAKVPPAINKMRITVHPPVAGGRDRGLPRWNTRDGDDRTGCRKKKKQLAHALIMVPKTCPVKAHGTARKEVWTIELFLQGHGGSQTPHCKDKDSVPLALLFGRHSPSLVPCLVHQHPVHPASFPSTLCSRMQPSLRLGHVLTSPGLVPPLCSLTAVFRFRPVCFNCLP